MQRRIAVFTDIHGNEETLKTIMSNIKEQNVDEIICLGDTISIGPNSKECIDILIENNVKMVLGNHELYLLRGTKIDSSIEGEEREHYKWIKESLTSKETEYIKKCPLFFEYTIKYENEKFNKKIIFSHYLINDEKDLYPFEKNKLDRDINLWIKHNKPDEKNIIGHLHYSFNPNLVNGISGDYIEETEELCNIDVLESAGCTKDSVTSYILINIDRSINYKIIKLNYDRDKFLNKVLTLNFPDKKNILRYFYGVEI